MKKININNINLLYPYKCSIYQLLIFIRELRLFFCSKEREREEEDDDEQEDDDEEETWRQNGTV